MKVHSSTLEKFPNCVKEFPSELMNEMRAQLNHSQTLHRLNERGGMGVEEILANIFSQGLDWTRLNPESQEQCNLLKTIIQTIKING